MNSVTAIKREFKDLRTQYEQAVLSGVCVDHAEYRHATGVLRGLALAEERILDLAKRLEQDDE